MSLPALLIFLAMHFQERSLEEAIMLEAFEQEATAIAWLLLPDADSLAAASTTEPNKRNRAEAALRVRVSKAMEVEPEILSVVVASASGPIFHWDSNRLPVGRPITVKVPLGAQAGRLELSVDEGEIRLEIAALEKEQLRRRFQLLGVLGVCILAGMTALSARGQFRYASRHILEQERLVLRVLTNLPAAVFAYQGERLVTANLAAQRLKLPPGGTSFEEAGRRLLRECPGQRAEFRLMDGETLRCFDLQRHDPEQEEAAVVLVVHETTERHRMERELAQRKSFAELGQLAVGVAHSLKNPLTGIRANAQILSRGDQDSETVADVAQIIIQESDRADRTVRRLMRLASSDHESVVQVDMRELLLEIVAGLAPFGRERAVEISLTVLADVEVQGKPQALREALENLAVNAIESHRQGGSVEIELGLSEKSCFVTIRDHGRGISPELRAKLGQPFVSHRPGGTGLGFAFARKCILEHGGALSLEPAQPGGALVRCQLPQGLAAAPSTEGTT